MNMIWVALIAGLVIGALYTILIIGMFGIDVNAALNGLFGLKGCAAAKPIKRG